MHHTFILAAYFMGLFGSTHCAAMCGGMASLPLVRKKDDIRSTPPAQTHPWRLLLIQNAARIVSYSIIGAVVGGLSSLVQFQSIAPFQRGLQIMLAVLLIGVGLYVLGVFPGFAVIEKIGAPLWRRIEPLARRVVPVDTPSRAFVFGLLWGWLPCGLVYSALALATSARNFVEGALTMAAFGIGTLPMLLGLGGLARGFQSVVRGTPMRSAAGLVIVAFGILQIYFTTAHNHHTLGASQLHDDTHTAHHHEHAGPH